MRHASLFSGIGGFDLAAQNVGWENVLHCEINPFCQRILQYYWPNAKTFTDIKHADFSEYRGTIDVLSGGFPCQPYSLAGKRLGKEDDRHLWPEMCRAIQEIQPSWVVGENVRGLISWDGGLVFHEVQSDLEAEGYEVLPLLLPAAAVGAPHERYRIWFVAYRLEDATDTQNIGQKQPRPTRDWRNGSSHHNCNVHATDANEPGWEEQHAGSQSAEQKQPSGLHAPQPSHSNGRRLEGLEEIPAREKQSHRNPWHEFPTQSPVCGGNDGLPPRLDGITFPSWREQSIQGFGNAVVPYLAQQIFHIINSLEKPQVA